MKRAFIINFTLSDPSVDPHALAEQLRQACQSVVPDPELTVTPWSLHGEGDTPSPTLSIGSNPFPSL